MKPIRNAFKGRGRPDLTVSPGERLLAWAETEDGVVVGGTRDAIYLPDAGRVPWERVQAADWDRDTSVLRVSEVGTWGEQRPEHDFRLTEPTRLLELVRERVTASVVHLVKVPISGGRGIRVVARRAPGVRGTIEWIYEFDEGIDPADPEVRTIAEQALAQAQAEVGEG